MSTVPHMTVDEFRRRGHQMIDWIADYLDTIEYRPVAASIKPGDLFRALPAHAPERGEAWDAIMRDVDDLILPAVTHWQHPHFYAYFPGNGSSPAILGDLLSTGLGVNGFLWATCPAITELETRVMDWLGEMIGLPPEFASSGSGGGVIQGTASEAAVVAMVAARGRAPQGQHVVYASSQAHSSIEKAAMVCGIGRENVRLIEVDEHLAMRADALERAIREDRAAGRQPTYVCATIGTTSTTAIDPLRAIGGICRQEGVWLHVDAAFAGAACVCPEFRWMIDGVGLADSFVFNPHKWLLTSFDCSALWVRERRALIDALSITPEYLRNAASDAGAVIDYRDWQIPLGRRFRALKLWFVIRHYGVQGLRDYIREHVRVAAVFEDLVRADGRFEVVFPRTLSLVCFRLQEIDASNDRQHVPSSSTGDRRCRECSPACQSRRV
jgi:aromatic-L-amino-acid decarboxylase